MRKSKVLLGAIILFLSSMNLIAGENIERGDGKAGAILFCKNLFDSQKAEFVGAKFVVIFGGKIKAVVPSPTSEEKGRFPRIQKLNYCLPGFIDTHVHFEQTVTSLKLPFSHPDEAYYAIQAVEHAKKTLMSGFTTVRDLISDRNIAFQLRGLVKKEEMGEVGGIVGPKIIAAGPAFGPQDGHGDFFNKVKTEGRPAAITDYLAYYAKKFVLGMSDVELWFDFYFDEKPNWYAQFPKVDKGNTQPDTLKIMATGGVLSANPNGHKPQLELSVVKEAIEQARIWGEKIGKKIPVAAHVHGFEGIENVAEAGVDSIEHATELFVDINDHEPIGEKRRKKLVEKIREKKIYMSPTLAAAQGVLVIGDLLGGTIQKKAKIMAPKMFSGFKGLVESGLTIVFGSDTGVSEHGENWHEFVFMKAYGDFSAEKGLASATKVAADSLGLGHQLGQIAPGYQADIIGFKKNPVDIINRIAAKIDTAKNTPIKGEWPIKFVMKNGRVYKNK